MFTHTQYCLDALVRLDAWRAARAGRKRLLHLAVLAHDFGKPATTSPGGARGQAALISPGHEAAGGPTAEAFLRRSARPRTGGCRSAALVVNHLVHHHGRHEAGYSDSQVRRLARRLAPATVDDLALVMTADLLGRPPLPSPKTIEPDRETAGSKAAAWSWPGRPPSRSCSAATCSPSASRPARLYGPLLGAAFEAQLDGDFRTSPAALRG